MRKKTFKQQRSISCNTSAAVEHFLAAACLSCFSPCVVETKVFSRLHIGIVPPFSNIPSFTKQIHIHTGCLSCRTGGLGSAWRLCISGGGGGWRGSLVVISFPVSSVHMRQQTYGSLCKFISGAFVWVITLIDTEKAKMRAAAMIGHQLIF